MMTFSSKSTTYWRRICTVSSKFNRITKKVIKSKDQSIIIVIAGGDGSMAKLIDDLIRESIDTSRIKFCILPFGTGNDLAQFTGWGNNSSVYTSGEISEVFKRLYNKIIKCVEIQVNIWEIYAEFRSALKVVTINNKNTIIYLEGTTILRKMVNYFSLGIESRIGMGFDKKRTSSKFCNLCVYFCEGFKKLCCLKTQTISNLVEYIAKDVEGMEIPLYQTSLLISQTPRIMGNPVSLVFSNITSFMGGKTHPWRDSKKLGISMLSTPLIPQSSCDNVLEIYAFPSNFKFTMELLCKGNALRIGQERGPLLIKFLKREVYVILGFNNIHEYRW